MKVNRSEITALKTSKGYSVFYCKRNMPQVALIRDGNYRTAKEAEQHAFENIDRLIK